MTCDERAAQSPTRLLVVEDFAPLAEAIAEFLSNAGLAVRIAKTGQEALQAVSGFRPEIVLFDLNLPDMSGLDVARALRSNPDTKDALLAMHTAMSDLELRTFRTEIPPDVVNLFLPKPLTEKEVARLLAEFAALRRPTCPPEEVDLGFHVETSARRAGLGSPS